MYSSATSYTASARDEDMQSTTCTCGRRAQTLTLLALSNWISDVLRSHESDISITYMYWRWAMHVVVTFEDTHHIWVVSILWRHQYNHWCFNGTWSCIDRSLAATTCNNKSMAVYCDGLHMTWRLNESSWIITIRKDTICESNERDAVCNEGSPILKQHEPCVINGLVYRSSTSAK